MEASNSTDHDAAVVLVAEDEPMVLQMLLGTLDRNGYIAIQAGNGGELVDVARQERPDVILMDVMMPLLDGYAAARVLRKDPSTRDIPIIAFQPPPPGNGGKSGSLRPSDERVLIERIQYVLESKNAHRGVRT